MGRLTDEYEALLRKDVITVTGSDFEINNEAVEAAGKTLERVELIVGAHFVEEGADMITPNGVSNHNFGSTHSDDAAGEHAPAAKQTTYDDETVVTYVQQGNLMALRELGAHETTHQETLEGGIPEGVSVYYVEGWTQWYTQHVLGSGTEVYSENVCDVRRKVREAGVSEAVALQQFRTRQWDRIREITGDDKKAISTSA